MKNYELLTYDDPDQREKWRRICSSFNMIDIYYYPEYLRLFELHGDGRPHLFVYYESLENILIYPFLMRSLKEHQQFHNLPRDLLDITSPYGYGGYLRNNSNINMEKFYLTFREFCKKNNIVSEFIRFHPILNNISYAPKNVDIKKNNETIIINLLEKEEKIWSDMSSRCRNSIRKALKNNIKVVNDINFNGIETFYNLYIDTMTKVGAKSYYFFRKEWFDNLIQLLRDNVALFHAYYQDKIIASAIFLYNKYFINYFLTGSLQEVKHLSANNLLLYEVALWAKHNGIKYFNLGGGYVVNDSLARFKSSFSHFRAEYFTGGVIHDNKYYDYLCNMIFSANEIEKKSIYFPLYRCICNNH
jgi:hypothetical protein